MAAAGGAAVVAGVRVCGLGDDQRTLGALIVNRRNNVIKYLQLIT